MYKQSKEILKALTFSLLSLSLFFPSATAQQFKPVFTTPVDINNVGAMKKRSRDTKMATDLLMMIDTYKGMKTGQSIDDVMPNAREFLVMQGDKIGLEIVATDVVACKTALKDLGATHIVHFNNMVNCMMPMAKLEGMAAMTPVSTIKLTYKPFTNIGAATSQGDLAQRSDITRAVYSVNGVGNKIGVLSDSYDDLAGAANDIASGDLPGAGNPNGFATPVDVILDFGLGGSDEGRAMLQIVHDVAPGAELAFNSAFFGQAAFAQGILDLNTAGCNIIVDDIIYFAEPYYMPGIVSQAVTQVCAAGSMYFSSAGNADRNSYEAIYTNGAPLCPFYLGAHEFAPGDQFIEITFPLGLYTVILQWDEPFFSVTGAASPASDVDLVLWDQDLNFIFGSFDLNNNGVGDAIEGIQGVFGGAFNFSIEHWNGPLPNRVKMIIYGQSPTWEYGGNAPTLVGHANTEEACAVGASAWFFTPAFGFGPPAGLNSFSSWGGVPIVMDATGALLPTPLVFNKPDFVAPDGGNTTFFVSDIPEDPDALPNFFGTSASAPHAAAAAALVFEANPGWTKTEVKASLENTAEDMLAPGFDFGSGAGLINVGGAVSNAIGANAGPNCRNLNASLAPDGFARITLADLLQNAAVGLGQMSVKVERGPVLISYREGVYATDPITLTDACALIGQELKVTISNSMGSCWSLLTLKNSHGPVLFGRNTVVYCDDDLVHEGGIGGTPPTVLIACNPDIPTASFVADWVFPYACEPGVQDTVKVIVREWEAFDKRGNRGVAFDTIVVLQFPEIDLRHIYCAERDTVYCADTTRRIGPYITYDNFGTCDTLYLLEVSDLDNDGILEFTEADFDDKCGLTVHADAWQFGSGCEKQYKIVVELKQSCYGTIDATCTVFPPAGMAPNMAEQLGPGYWRCEFWLSDQDTTPPLIAPKVIGEYSCLVIDTTDLLQGNIFNSFVPLVSTSSHDCVAHTTLPPVCVYDDWSGIKIVKATIEGFGSYILSPSSDTCVIFNTEDGAFSFGGDLTDQFLMELSEQFGDTLPPELFEQIKIATCYRSNVTVPLPMRDDPYLVIYEVMDSCHLIGRDTALIKVKDQTAPVAISDKGVTVSLSDKKVWVDAETFDEGSWDNCNVEFLLARRADWKEACLDLCYNYDDTTCQNKESALCWLWTDGHDTLWLPELEGDKHCNEVEAHYQKQLDWFCKDESSCGKLLYNSWLYDLIKYATVECKGDNHLTDEAFDKLFRRAVGDPQNDDQFKITNDSLLTFLKTILELDSFFVDSNHIQGGFIGLDIFKCQEVLSDFCIDLFGDELGSPIFDDTEFLQFLISGGCLSAFDVMFPDIFVPLILPESVQDQVFDNWKNIGGGWSDAVPFSCEDACGPVTVEILVMDYWCNWSTTWTNVWVEDKTPIQVVKDVVEQEVITCKVYKENNYGYPGEEHPVSIQYIVDQAKAGEQAGFDALDGIFGGYCKAWRDPYGNYVDIEGNEINCDIPFYDSVCDCKDTTIKMRVYDEHLGYLWIDSLVKDCYYEPDTLNFQKGVVVVNCAENVHCEQEVWCEFDHCGQGYIFRKFKIWSSCLPAEGESQAGAEASADGASYPTDSSRHIPDTIYRHQRIWVGNECDLDKYMFDVPYDTDVVSCAIEYGPDGNVIGDAGPENTGYATYKFDDDCRLVGIAHEDKVFKIVGGEEACYKILRTWYFADWCDTGTDATDASVSTGSVSIPKSKWWLDNSIIKDQCVQKIIVIDTVAPVCVITGPVASGDSVALSACDYDLAVTVDAMDACGLTSYYWELKDITDAEEHTLFDSGSGDLNGDTKDNFEISSDDLYPGTYKLKVEIMDECTNESYCEYVITVTSGKKPSPVCINSLTARLTPWDSDGDGEVDTAHAIVWAYEYDRSSEPACEDDSLEYRLEILDGSEDDLSAAGDLDFLEIGCADIGTHLVRMWVISHPSGSSDYCDAVLVVQSDGSGCPTTGTGEQVMVTEGEKATATKSAPGKDNSAGDKTMIISGDAFGTGADREQGYSLDQNSPNPFQYETQIGFTLPTSMEASIEIYDLNGRLLKTVRGDFARGHNAIALDRVDLQQSGVLYYRLRAGSHTATKRMILIE